MGRRPGMKRRLTVAVAVWLLDQRHALGFAPTVVRDRIKKPACCSRLPVTRVKSSASTSASLDVDVPATAQATSLPDDWQNQILSGLSVIQDPDLNSDIVSLGFVTNLRVDDSFIVSFDLELTTPACPVKEEFVKACQDVINSLEWSRGAEVTLTAQETAPTSPFATNVPLGMSQIGSVIAVSSCKGGVGKSTTSVNLAFALQSLGARVGIFDVDLYGPSLPTMVTPDDDDVRFVGRQIQPLKRNDVALMSFGYVNEGSAVMRGPMVTQLLDQFLSLTNWGALDYLILDMPPGTGDIQLTLTQKLNIDAAVIVTTPQELSFVDVERGVEMFDTVNVPCVAVVENMAYLEAETSTEVELDETLLEEKFVEALDGRVSDAQNSSQVQTLAKDLVKLVQANISKENRKGTEEIRIFGKGHKRRLSEQWGIEHTYSVPLLGKIAENGDSGTPFILQNPESPQAEIYAQLAKSVVSEVAKTKYMNTGRPAVSYDEEKHSIVIDDGEKGVSNISPANLRRACRCASCVEELTGEQILDPESIEESIRPLLITPTGNYALSVDWSSGHKSLYPYRQLRSLVENET